MAAVLGALVGCASTQQPQPRSWTERVGTARALEARAGQHERNAQAAERQPQTYACGDTVVADQSTSGGERLQLAVPCSDVNADTARYARHEARNARAVAHHEREVAESLLEAELHSCRGIPARELEHSPFEQRRAIASVVPYRAGDTVRGVRITLAPAPGLTAQRLEHAIRCHQARYATFGQPSDFMPFDPTVVPGARVTVTERGRHLEVLVESPDPDAGQLALQRARDLVAPAEAAR